MSPRRPLTWADRYSDEHLAALDAMVCIHDEPKGARYCPLCRRAYARQRQGRTR